MPKAIKTVVLDTPITPDNELSANAVGKERPFGDAAVNPLPGVMLSATGSQKLPQLSKDGPHRSSSIGSSSSWGAALGEPLSSSFPFQNLTQLAILEEGHYGVVLKMAAVGLVTPGVATEVAVKMLRSNASAVDHGEISWRDCSRAAGTPSERGSLPRGLHGTCNTPLSVAGTFPDGLAAALLAKQLSSTVAPRGSCFHFAPNCQGDGGVARFVWHCAPGSCHPKRAPFSDLGC
jgi:hypothetical protein